MKFEKTRQYEGIAQKEKKIKKIFATFTKQRQLYRAVMKRNTKNSLVDKEGRSCIAHRGVTGAGHLKNIKRLDQINVIVQEMPREIHGKKILSPNLPG